MANTNKNRDNITPTQREHIETRLNRKCNELNKHYPDKKYEVKDNMVVRVSGVRPHKKSKKVQKV